MRIVLDAQRLAACYEKVDYAKASLRDSVAGKFSVDQAREILSKFTEIKAVKECYLVRYEVTKKP